MRSVYSRYIRLHGLEQTVGIMGIVKDWSSDKNMNRLLQNGVSRVSLFAENISWSIDFADMTVDTIISTSMHVLPLIFLCFPDINS